MITDVCVVYAQLADLVSRLKSSCDGMLAAFDCLCQSLSPDILSLLVSSFYTYFTFLVCC